ncbi:MAG: type II secretion system protein M [Caulobacter sp.]|nr:type II secretion system protein M [Caulobacter sp.]
MTAFLDSLRTAWTARSPRERIMLTGLGLIIALVVGWYGMVQPLAHGVAASEQRARRAAAMLADLEAAARAGGASPGAVAAEARQPLTAVVAATAQAAGVTVDRRREEPDGRLTVWLTGVSPTVMMTWLTALAQAHGVAVSDITASRLDNGLIEAQITLERPAG